MRTLLVAVCLLAACEHPKPAKHLDFAKIVVDHARLRTDIVGVGKFEENSAFVLADAKNTTSEGAYVSLGGELLDGNGQTLSQLRAQSIWIPGGESRTFALVDEQRKPRPEAKGTKVVVRGALVPEVAPPAHIEDLHVFDDHGQVVVQAYVVNTADRLGTVTVLAAFHDEEGLPIQRPFSLEHLAANEKRSIRFVGPKGAKTGTIYVGEAVY